MEILQAIRAGSAKKEEKAQNEEAKKIEVEDEW
jgi:hypothetical protein